MAKKNLKLRTMVAPAQTIIAAAYDENGKADDFRIGAAMKKELE